METLRIPVRYKKIVSRLSPEEQGFVFVSLLKLASGDDVILPDSLAGDVLEQILRDAKQMENKNTKMSEMSVGELVPANSVSPARVSSESLGNIPGYEGEEEEEITPYNPPPGDPGKKSQKSRSPSSQEVAFEEFWKNYPRKVGKAAAKKSWLKKPPDLATVIAALEWQSKQEQWTRGGGQFIPHPSTWLNQERWADEKPPTEEKTPEDYVPEFMQLGFTKFRRKMTDLLGEEHAQNLSLEVSRLCEKL